MGGTDGRGLSHPKLTTTERKKKKEDSWAGVPNFRPPGNLKRFRHPLKGKPLSPCPEDERGNTGSASEPSREKS